MSKNLNSMSAGQAVRILRNPKFLDHSEWHLDEDVTAPTWEKGVQARHVLEGDWYGMFACVWRALPLHGSLSVRRA